MAKKKRTIGKKGSASGKSCHDSDILRAKRAVSAAASGGSSSRQAPRAEAPASASAGPAAGLVPGIMKRLLRAASSSFTPAAEAEPSGASPSEKPALLLNFSGNPLADLARRHVRQAGQFQPDPSDSDESHCRHILASLAKARIQGAFQASSSNNQALSGPSVFNGS